MQRSYGGIALCFGCCEARGQNTKAKNEDEDYTGAILPEFYDSEMPKYPSLDIEAWNVLLIQEDFPPFFV